MGCLPCALGSSVSTVSLASRAKHSQWVGRWVGKGEMQSPYRAGCLHSSRGEPWPHAHAARVASNLEPGTGADPTHGQQRARRQVGFREFAAKCSWCRKKAQFWSQHRAQGEDLAALKPLLLTSSTFLSETGEEHRCARRTHHKESRSCPAKARPAPQGRDSTSSWQVTKRLGRAGV